MQHQVSHPLSSAGAVVRRGSRSDGLLSLPNARDERYPRQWRWRLWRVLASVCWLPFAVIVGYAGAKTALLLRDGAAPNLSAMGGALGLDGVVAATQQQPALLAGAVPLMGLLIAAVWAMRWAGADRLREAQSLLLREVSPSEQANTSWMRNACLPALQWRVRSLQRRRLLTGLALLLAALLLGALLALLFAGASMPLAALFVPLS